MKIPISIKLYGRTITTVFDPNLVASSNNLGEARYRTDEIALQPSTEGRSIPPLQLEENYCHELVHWLLYRAGITNGDTVIVDERLVEVLGGLLHQALITAEYDSENS